MALKSKADNDARQSRWGKNVRKRGTILKRVDGIDELILEEFQEPRVYEKSVLPLDRRFLKGKVMIQKGEQATKEAEQERSGLVFWTDGLRRENECVGCAVIWKDDKWRKRRVHLGQQKEAFDAEMYAISEAEKIADEMMNK